MNFRDFLREAKEVHHTFAFGRMSPPTTGHEVLVNKVKEVSKQHGGDHSVVLSHTQDKDKNPLSAEQKLKHAKRFFPNTNLSTSSKEKPTFLQHAAELHKKGVTHLHMVAGSDRVAEYKKKLAQYNGTHEGALYNFKKITVHNAGERDPDAEGTAGMSASKMRSHAKAGEFHHFKKGIPSHVSENHAREMYHDVRKGMQVKEDINDDFADIFLIEGVHDHGIFKAVFLSGGPGSGKDYVLDNTLAGHGLVEMNSDKALEFLMDKEGLDKKMPSSEEEKRNLVRGRAKNITELRQRLAIAGRNGLIINGTGDDIEKTKKIKAKLESAGYETSMLLVNTQDEVSKKRNIERGMRGGRTVPEDIRKDKWDNVQRARAEYSKLFGGSYMEFDNSEDLRSADPTVVKAKKDELMQLFKGIKEFVARPPKTKQADDWIAQELDKKDTLPVPKNGAERSPHPDSAASEAAKKLGLQYFGFGRYGKQGKVTHRSVHDKLVEVPKDPIKEPNVPTTGTSAKKPVKEDFLNDDILELFEEKKVKLLRKPSGGVYKFLLRRSAAKHAHTHEGEVIKYKDGYAIKIKEENENVEISKESIHEETGTRASYGSQTGSSSRGTGVSYFAESRSARTSIGSSDSGGSTDSGYYTETTTTPTSKKTISLSEIRAKQKEKMIEAIDMGIEPGLSMSSAGENFSRGVSNTIATTGSKYNRDPKKKTIKELTGDETGASIGDQKEGELKRVGINIKTFKAKKFI